jgi:GTPase SAR1 family protein
MTDIIAILPRELQVKTFQYLVQPNERVLLVGNPGVGKSSFIRAIKKEAFSSRYVPTDSICFNTVHNVSIIELGGQGKYSSAYKKAGNPTRIIIMADVTSDLSMKEVINFHLPKYSTYNVPITIVFNKVDIPRTQWKNTDLHP